MKFCVGDHIAANIRSNERYSITCQRKGWTGYVRAVNGDQIKVGEKREGGCSMWWVESYCFDLVESEALVIPESDLFASLFG